MLSYQHAYHAGSLADIHKHGTLTVLLSRMREKPRPLTYMETHSGRGLYDVAAPESRKTGEAQLGIIKLMADGVLPKSHPFCRLIGRVRDKYGKTAYPGSPLIARSLLNADDPMHLMELHPAEFEALRENMRDSGAHVHHRDGYEGVWDLSPPPPGQPRRGLVVIDPSYEIKTEYEDTARFIAALHDRWPEVTIMLWYPILKTGLHEAMVDFLIDSDLKNLTRHEVSFQTGKDGHGLLGSGIIIINAPYGAEKGLDVVERWVSS